MYIYIKKNFILMYIYKKKFIINKQKYLYIFLYAYNIMVYINISFYIFFSI